jgi:hypothetical protein
MPGLGRVQRGIWRAFAARPGSRLTTVDLVAWAYPRLRGEPKNKHRHCIRQAAPHVADRVGRTYPGGFIWREKQSQSLPSDENLDR